MATTIYLIRPETYPSSTSYLLDTYTATAAYSLRQLKTGVTSVVRVRRSSDNAESDFSPSDITDGTLTTWVGAGNDGFVVTVYDQVGSNDVTQAAGSSQPLIVEGGSLLTTGSLPCVDFSTSTGGNRPPMDFTSAVTFQTAFIVAKTDVQNTVNYVLGNESPAQGVYWNGSAAAVSGIGAFDGTNANDLTGEDLNQHLGYLNMRSSNLYVAKDGATETNTGTFASSLTVDLFGGRSAASSIYSRGTMQEVILFNSDESGNKSDIESDINTYYSI